MAHLRLTGSYPLADTDRILTALAATLPVQVRRVLPSWWMTVEATAAVASNRAASIRAIKTLDGSAAERSR